MLLGCSDNFQAPYILDCKLEVKLFFRNEGEIKSFSDDRKLEEYVTRRLALKELQNTYSKQKGNNNKRLQDLRKKEKWI